MTAYHSEDNRQTERINSHLKAYLWDYINLQQNNWKNWLSIAEFFYNNLKHTFTGVSSFFTNYRHHPPFNVYEESEEESLRKAVATTYADKIKELHMIFTATLLKLQKIMKKNINKHCKNIKFQKEDVVWLRTQNIKIQQLCKKLNYKKIKSYFI